MSKIGFHIDRTITMKEDFVRPSNKSVRRSWAEIVVQGHTYRVNVTIDGDDDLRLPGIEKNGKHADADRKCARQWIALYDLAQRPTRDFEKGSGDLPPEVDVAIPDAPASSGNWTIEELRRYVVQGLAGYSISEWAPGMWQVRPKG